MNPERRLAVPLSRQTFLKGTAGIVATAGLPRLQAGGFPAQRVDSARPAHHQGGQRASVTIDLSRPTGKRVHPYLYGYATRALLDKDFMPTANGDIEASAETL